MNTYEFKAVTSKGEMIMGLCFPVSLIFPSLAIYLTLFYSGAYDFLRERPEFAWIAFLPGIYITYFLLKKTRKYAAKDFFVRLNGRNVSVWESGNEILAGDVLFCKIKAEHDRMVQVEISTEEGSLSLKARPAEYKTITGSFSFNPFGVSSTSDMKQLAALGRELDQRLESA